MQPAMTGYFDFKSTFPDGYLAGSRLFTHVLFWLCYYLLFSLIWMRPEAGYFASFYLEFVLMPVRIMAAYCMLYFLIPHYLEQRQYLRFVQGYSLLILIAGALQMIFSYFFYEQLLLQSQEDFSFSLAAWIRNMVLVNTTVLLLGAIKVFQLYIRLRESLLRQQDPGSAPAFIEVKAERSVHRLRFDDILYVQGMGNYVTYYLNGGDKKVVYSSLKDSQQQLPSQFVRLHRSYIANKDHIDSYNQEQVVVAGHSLPRGKDVADSVLA